MIEQLLISKIKELNNRLNKKNGKKRALELNKLIPNSLLIKEYQQLNRNSILISQELGVSNPYICKRLKKLGILRSISEIHKGNLNPMWKDDKVDYPALHKWIFINKPKKELCENCKKVKPFDLANISGEYKRDINDFKWLCRSCHMKEDGRREKLIQRIIKQNKTNNPKWKKKNNGKHNN
jgi:hypothetical protein